MNPPAAMVSKPRATLPTDAFTLPARYYTDPAIFDRERERFTQRMWISVARVEDLPAPGAYVTREIAGDNVIVLRRGRGDADVRAFFNVCRHRGTRLCGDAAGTL